MRSPALLACVLAAAVGGCTLGFQSDDNGNSDGTITIANDSTHVIVEVRVTSIGSSSWGANLLPDVLYPDEQITVSVVCDTYDVLVSDDAARDCVLGNVDLCFSNKVWTLDNATLRNCGY